MALKLVTLNARGLRSNKRYTIFNWLRENKYDICFLQETYCTKEYIDQFKLGWKGDIYLQTRLETETLPHVRSYVWSGGLREWEELRGMDMSLGFDEEARERLRIGNNPSRTGWHWKRESCIGSTALHSLPLSPLQTAIELELAKDWKVCQSGMSQCNIYSAPS